MGEEVKIFRHWYSSFALRVVWALNIKGIEYEAIFEDLSNKSPLLIHYNPIHKKVPVLVHKGKPICESRIILEYIDETWKDNPLLPQDPYEKAKARFWAKFNDDKVLPSIVDAYATEGKVQEEKTLLALENLKLVEEQLKGKEFFGGDKIGFLDLVFGWMANLVSVWEEVGGIILIDEQNFPLLSAWIYKFSIAPGIREHWPSRDKLITSFKIRREARLAAAK